jgi:hypothetical protein
VSAVTDAPPRVVYVITDAAPGASSSTHTVRPGADAPPLPVRLCRRLVLAMVGLFALTALVWPYACPWWAYALTMAWVLWPLARPARRAVAVTLIAADALVTAAIGTRRLVYLAALLRRAARESRTPTRDSSACDSSTTGKDAS